ncbi:MAG TPA: TonB-dependent receptor [Burkholderiales bacterium]|nr:TonB-dependent receptor [Burkholderiales bacterium]
MGKLRMTTCGWLLACMPPLALAQQASDNEGVTVTATRNERPSLEVPASIDRVYGDEIHLDRQEVNLSESLGAVPGIVAQNRQNYAQDLQISSRGFGARSTFGIRGLRLLVDGIPASMPDGQGQVSHVDLGSTEKIEVLRGPFSVMYGNAAGGVINIFTQSGSSAPGFAASAEGGSFGTWRAGMKAGGRSGNDDWLASTARFETDGYRDHSSARRDDVNSKLRFGLGTPTTVTVVANYFNSPEVQDPLGLTRAQLDADRRQAGTNALAFDTRKSVLQNQIGGTLEHRFGDNTLSATLYAGDRTLRQYLAIPLGAQNAPTSSGGVVDLQRSFGGAGLHLSHDAVLAGRPLSLSVGAEYELQDEHRRGFINDFGDMTNLKRDEDDTVVGTGVYAQAEWHPAEKWIAIAGVRANRVAFDSVDHFIVLPANPDDSGNRNFSATTPTAGLLYRITPAASAYVSYGQGFETPTLAEMAYKPGGGTGLNFGLEPATSHHWETGIKALFASNLQVNFALYDVRTQNEIVVDTNSGGRATYVNAGRTHRSGAELGASATLPYDIRASLAWTLLDATFEDTFTTPASGTVAAGNVLPGVPRNSVYGALRWRHVPTGFNVLLEAQYRSRIAADDANTQFADGYAIANLALGFVQRAGGWQLSEFARVDNMFDKAYVGSVIVNEANQRYFEPAPGRAYMVGVQARHGF